NCDGTGLGPLNDGGNFVTDGSCGSGFSSAVVADVQLGPLQTDSSGLTYHLPLPSSPLVDAGLAGCPASDQRGVPRWAQCDSGAVELNWPVYLPLLRR